MAEIKPINTSLDFELGSLGAPTKATCQVLPNL